MDLIRVCHGKIPLQNPLTEIRKVEQFLGISSFYSSDHFYFPEGSKFPCFRKNSEAEPTCMRGDKGRSHPDLKNETYDHLKKYFKPKMDEFEKLTGIHYEL